MRVYSLTRILLGELVVILLDELGLPTKRKPRQDITTNADVLEKSAGKHPIIDCLLEYRKLTKLHSTYIVGLSKVVGAIGFTPPLNQAETRTEGLALLSQMYGIFRYGSEEGSKIGILRCAGGIYAGGRRLFAD